MRLRLRDDESMRTQLGSAYGLATPAEADLDLFEVVRCEISALGPISRRVLMDGIVQRLEPLFGVARDRLLAVIQHLEVSGDILRGPGGQVAPAPLRLVQLTEVSFGVVGSVPRRILLEHLTPCTVTGGLLRRLHVDSAPSAKLAEQLQALGGRILSVEWWTGLARTPPAGNDWLEMLEARRLEQAAAPGELDTADWQGLRFYGPSIDVSVQSRRWNDQPESEGGQLIRAEQPGGWWAFAWQGPVGSTGTSTRLCLSRDEAIRTMFSLDARAGIPLTLTAQQEGDEVVLELNLQLPRAEYRYLLARSEPEKMPEQMSGQASRGAVPKRLRFPASLWPGVSGLLQERLKLTIRR